MRNGRRGNHASARATRMRWPPTMSRKLYSGAPASLNPTQHRPADRRPRRGRDGLVDHGGLVAAGAPGGGPPGGPPGGGPPGGPPAAAPAAAVLEAARRWSVRRPGLAHGTTSGGYSRGTRLDMPQVTSYSDSPRPAAVLGAR